MEIDYQLNPSFFNHLARPFIYGNRHLFEAVSERESTLLCRISHLALFILEYIPVLNYAIAFLDQFFGERKVTLVNEDCETVDNSNEVENHDNIYVSDKENDDTVSVNSTHSSNENDELPEEAPKPSLPVNTTVDVIEVDPDPVVEEEPDLNLNHENDGPAPYKLPSISTITTSVTQLFKKLNPAPLLSKLTRPSVWILQGHIIPQDGSGTRIPWYFGETADQAIYRWEEEQLNRIVEGWIVDPATGIRRDGAIW